MDRNFLSFLFIGLLLVGNSVPFASAASISTSSVSSTSNLTGTTTPQISNFNPSKIPNYFGSDIGSISWQTTLSGFKWNTTTSDSLVMTPSMIGANSLPISQLYFNSSETAYQFSGIGYTVNFYFKPSQYSTTIIISGSVTTSSTISISLSSNSTKAVCDDSGCTQARFGNEIFDWADIPSGDSPIYNNVTKVLSFVVSGSFLIDPLALDGTGSCAANGCTATVTTSNAGDMLVILEHDNNPGCNTPTGAITWTFRVQEQGGDADCVAEYYSTNSGSGFSAGTYSGTCNWTTGNAAFCMMFGISGANLASPFDSNAAVPCANNAGGVSSNPSCTISTSNANDFIIGAVSEGNGHVWTVGSGFTAITSASNDCTAATSRHCDEYKIVSTTQTNLAVGFTMTVQDSFWDMIADAIKQATATTVTETITITTLTSGAPSGTITLVNCGYSNGTLTADGFPHVYTGVTAACITTLRNAAAGSSTRYEFNISPHPTISRNVNFTTASSGSGSYSNNTYYQLKNTYTANPSTPLTWDAIYTWSISGKFLGVASTLTACTNTANGGGSVSCSNAWYDYNLAVSFPGTIGNTWTAQSPSSFTDTTAGNTHTVNYIQSSGTSNNGIAILAIAAAGFVFLASRRRKIPN